MTKDQKNKRKILVIGGGASGLAAAIAAAGGGASVTILEQNERPGRKLLASGNGKCNMTNLDQDPSHYHGADAERIAAVLSQFPAEEVIRFFSSLGLRTFDRNGWVYPSTEQSGSVLELLLLECRRLGVRIKNSEKAEEILRSGSGFTVRTGTWKYAADAVVVACGSPASAVRGASASAIGFASSFGIAAEAFSPALVPLKADGDHLSAWAGVRAHGAIRLYSDGVLLGSGSGEIQFTDRGISGIPVMQLSHLAGSAAAAGHAVTVHLDLCPELPDAELADLLVRIRTRDPGKNMAQAAAGILPEKLIPVLVPAGSYARDPAGLAASSMRRECLHASERIKHFSVLIRGTASLRQAQVCAGGIRLDALSDHMECMDEPGLFFTGECVNVYGDCGGYNLQWAWSSGTAAGRCAAEERR